MDRKALTHASKLSGQTNSAGKLRLAVCASVSGAIEVHSSGAIPSSAIMLRVKGGPPMSPMSVTVRSSKPGQAAIAWAPPVYAGGAPVTRYEITAKDAGKTYKFVVANPRSSKSLVHTFTGLPQAHKCSFTVTAVTKYGSSPAAATQINVP